MKHTIFAATVALGLGLGAAANALTFTFTEDLSGVTMTASGSIDISGLVDSGTVYGWGGVGYEENGNHDILGNTTNNYITDTYLFHDGTDFSAWESATGPYGQRYFSWSVSSGAEDFATHTFVGGAQTPAFSFNSSDLAGTVWSSDQTWLASGQTFASIGLNEGTYTVTDAVSGEYISIVVGDAVPAVPLPAGFPLLLGGLGAFGMLRRKKSA